MNDIVRLIPVHSIEFHQHTPKRYGMIGHPAEKERQDHYSDGPRDLRSSFGVALHAPLSNEPQQQQVTDGDRRHRQNKSN